METNNKLRVYKLYEDSDIIKIKADDRLDFEIIEEVDTNQDHIIRYMAHRNGFSFYVEYLRVLDNEIATMLKKKKALYLMGRYIENFNIQNIIEDENIAIYGLNADYSNWAGEVNISGVHFINNDVSFKNALIDDGKFNFTNNVLCDVMTSFENAKFFEADFTGSKFDCVNFTLAVFDGVTKFENAEFNNVNFDYALFQGDGTAFKESSFNNVSFESTRFLGSYLSFENASFNNVIFEGAEFTEAIAFINVCFNDLSFKNSIFKHSPLIFKDVTCSIAEFERIDIGKISLLMRNIICKERMRFLHINFKEDVYMHFNEIKCLEIINCIIKSTFDVLENSNMIALKETIVLGRIDIDWRKRNYADYNWDQRSFIDIDWKEQSYDKIEKKHQYKSNVTLALKIHSYYKQDRLKIKDLIYERPDSFFSNKFIYRLIVRCKKRFSLHGTI